MSESPVPNTGELRSQALSMGLRTLDVLRRFGLNQVDEGEVLEWLSGLGAREALAERWSQLLADPESGACFETLQLLASLEGEARYQLLRYGPTSLFEDYKELERLVARLRKTAKPLPAPSPSDRRIGGNGFERATN